MNERRDASCKSKTKSMTQSGKPSVPMITTFRFDFGSLSLPGWVSAFVFIAAVNILVKRRTRSMVVVVIREGSLLCVKLGKTLMVRIIRRRSNLGINNISLPRCL